MADIKITDLVDEKVFEELANLSQGIKEVKQQYIEAAQELAKGLNVKVSTAGDLQKLNEAVAESSRKAQQATDQLNTTIDKQREIIGQTTNVISRELAEIEKENKAKRDAFAQDKDALDIAKSIIGTRDQNILRLSKLQTELKNVKESQKSLDDAVKAGTISENAAVAKRAEYLEQQRTLKAAIHDLNGILNNQDKQMQAANGSYQQLSLQLEMMKKAYKSLNDEEKNSDIGKKLGDEIQNMDAHLKDLAADMGEFQRNTGNYAIAQGNVKTEMRELVQELALLTIQYRSMSDEEQQSASGKQLEEKIQVMTQKAATLKDAVNDVNRAVQAGANDTKNFTAITEGINLVISGFGSLKGAATLLGLSEKDLVKVQTQLQAALVISNGLTKAQNLLQKESNLMQGVAIVQKRAHAIAENIKTAATGRGIVATKAATVAQAAFNAVANMNPYVLLATGIGLVVAAAITFTKALGKESEQERKAQAQMEDFRKELESTRKEYEEYADVIEKVNDARLKGMQKASDEVVSLQLLYKAATDVTLSYENRKKATDKLQELYPDYFKNLSDEAIMAGEAESAYKRLTQAIYDKAIAEAKQDLIKEYASKYIKSLDDIRKAQRLLNDETERYSQLQDEYNSRVGTSNSTQTQMYGTVGVSLSQMATMSNSSLRDIETSYYNTGVRVRELTDGLRELTDQSKDYYDSMQEVMSQLNETDLSALLGGKTTGGSGGPKSSAKEETAKSLDEIKETILDKLLEIYSLRVSMSEQGSKEEYDLTIKYIDAELVSKKLKIKKSYEEEVEELRQSLKLKTITQEQYNEQLTLINKNYNDNNLLMEQKAIIAKTNAQKKYTEAVVKSIQEQYTKEQSQRDLSLIQEQTTLAKQRAQKIISEDEYQRQLAELQQRYAIEAANKQVEMLERVLEVENITAEKREKIAQKLAEVKIKLAKQIADEEVKQTKRSEKEDEKAADKKKRTLGKYLQTASRMIGQLNSLVSTIYDGQLEKIDEEKEANDKRYEEEIAQIENLQETGAISQEEAEARKRAAEQRTAEKEEEIEKKKKEIKYKQAMWEKATSIAQAGIATAVAITEALPNVVLAALVGALGAMEVATILATPISTYAKGTGKDGHKGGLALVGDGGKQEAVVYGGKMWITPDTPTLVDMPKGAMVYPDANKIPEPVLQNVSMTKDSKPVVIVNTDTRKLEKGMDKNNRLLQHAIIATQRAQYNANYQAYKARL